MTPPPSAPPPATRRAARLRVALPLAWAVLLLYLTLAPAERLPPTPQWKLLSFDTFAHAAFFAVQAALTWLSLRRQTRWPRLARRATAAVLLGCLAFGALIEALQMALPFNRHGEWSDLISDGLGAAAALGLLVRATGPLLRRGWIIGLLLAFSLPPSPAQSQDIPRTRATIARLASRGMHGRGYVRQGEHKAAAYLRGRLRNLKLTPLAPNYTQPFELDVNTFPGAMQVAVAPNFNAVSKTQAELIAGRDFNTSAASGAANFSNFSFPLDTLIFQDTALARRYLLPPLGAKYKACSSCPLVLRVADQSRLLTLPSATQVRIAQCNQIVLVSKLTASLASQQAPALRLEVLTSKWPFTEAQRAVQLRIDAQLQRHYPTQNLCAVIPGRTQPDSFLIVAAHYDHLGTMGKKAYFPGANDNASGVALLLELAAHYAKPENRPACSIAFLLFGAEEAGLVGSRYFVQHPLVPLQQIKFLINLDLLGTGEEGATVVNGRVHEAAFQQLQKLNEAGRYLPGLAVRGRAANSDHYPFSEAGVPAFFIYTRGGSSAYHDVNDTPDRLSLAGFAGAFRLVRDFLNAHQPAGSLPPR